MGWWGSTDKVVDIRDRVQGFLESWDLEEGTGFRKDEDGDLLVMGPVSEQLLLVFAVWWGDASAGRRQGPPPIPFNWI